MGAISRRGGVKIALISRLVRCAGVRLCPSVNHSVGLCQAVISAQRYRLLSCLRPLIYITPHRALWNAASAHWKRLCTPKSAEREFCLQNTFSFSAPQHQHSETRETCAGQRDRAQHKGLQRPSRAGSHASWANCRLEPAPRMERFFAAGLKNQIWAALVLVGNLIGVQVTAKEWENWETRARTDTLLWTLFRSRCGVKFTAHKKRFPTAFAVTSAKVIPFAAVYLRFVVRISWPEFRSSNVLCSCHCAGMSHRRRFSTVGWISEESCTRVEVTEPRPPNTASFRLGRTLSTT